MLTWTSCPSPVRSRCRKASRMPSTRKCEPSTSATNMPDTLGASVAAPADPHTPETTMDDEALITKFRTFAEQGLSTRAIDQCIERGFALDELPDVRRLTDVLA